MNFVKKHYEKLLLGLALLVLVPIAVVKFLDSVNNDLPQKPPMSSSFSLDEINDEQTISLLKETSLLPNDLIRVYNSANEKILSTSITKVIYKKKSKVSVKLKTGRTLEGRLLSSNNLVMTKNWQRSRTPIAIDSEDGVFNLNMNEIDFIKGYQKLVTDKDLIKFEDEDCSISVYQSASKFLIDSNQTDKTRWINYKTDHNETIYDLFTPPIIYLVDGELTTSLPEAPKEEEKEEEFGLILTRFEKSEYRLKLVSWIGQVPYFEDLTLKISTTSTKNVKNRIEPKIPYKNNENYRPGMPSLVKTTMEDENKVFMVEYFTVQQIKDPRTGGVKPVGRAMVRDFQKGGAPFEINSRMEQVYSGDYELELEVNLPGEIPQKIILNSKDLDREISIGNRIFKILEMNETNRSVKIEKAILGNEDSIVSTLKL